MSLSFKKDSYYYGRKHRRVWLLRFAIFACACLIIAAAAFAIFFWNRHGENSGPDNSSKSRTINYQPNQTFTTSYFTFQTDKNWKAVPAESTSTQFVYRSFKSQIVERELTVYVNQLPPRLMLTYVLPVQVAGNKMQPGDISQHCRTSLPADYLAHSNNPRDTVMGGVNFLCWTDSSRILIGTGIKGGSYQATMPHQGGSAQYFLLYNDVAYTPRPEVFKDIVQNFQSK